MASTLRPPVAQPPLHPSHRGALTRQRYLVWTWVVNRVCRLLGHDRLSSRLRRAVLTRYGWHIGPGTQIDGIGYVYGQVQIGAGTYINRDSYFEAEAPIIIGDGVSLGPGIMFLTVTHQMGPPERRAGEFDVRPITVGDGVWIGARAVLLPGVQIGAGAVVAAGAVVTADVPPNTLVTGVPAQVKKHLDSHSSHPW